MMGLIDYIWAYYQDGLANRHNRAGRASRKQFWLFQLVWLGAVFLLVIVPLLPLSCLAISGTFLGLLWYGLGSFFMFDALFGIAMFLSVFVCVVCGIVFLFKSLSAWLAIAIRRCHDLNIATSVAYVFAGCVALLVGAKLLAVFFSLGSDNPGAGVHLILHVLHDICRVDLMIIAVFSIVLMFKGNAKKNNYGEVSVDGLAHLQYKLSHSYLITMYRDIFRISGRASRQAYMFALIEMYILVLVLSFVVIFSDAFFHLYLFDDPFDGDMFFVVMVAIALLAPLPAMQVRRLHDLKKSGAIFFLNLIPYASFILFWVLILCKGQPHDHEHVPAIDSSNEPLFINE